MANAVQRLHLATTPDTAIPLRSALPRFAGAVKVADVIARQRHVRVLFCELEL
jgi:hypothetical protein